MSDKDKEFDLDFDDVSGGTEQVPSVPRSKKKFNATKQDTPLDNRKPDGVTIPVPTEEGYSNPVPIEEVSGEDFVAWMANIHPQIKQEQFDIKNFDGEENLINRKEAYKEVVDQLTMLYLLPLSEKDIDISKVHQ